MELEEPYLCHTCGTRKFLGRSLNPRRIHSPHQRCRNTGFTTHCAGPGIHSHTLARGCSQCRDQIRTTSLTCTTGAATMDPKPSELMQDHTGNTTKTNQIISALHHSGNS